MKTIKISTALKRLRRLNEEIRYCGVFEGATFTSGVIAFGARRNGDSKQINHPDKDVICQVIRGRGRLRIGARRIGLAPGVVCHIPNGTPHDFAAERRELILFYSLIRTK